MVVFTVDDLEIQFPFMPYNVQKDFMKKVVECIDNKQNGLLESPTGTGKTLSLLCAAIAWQKRQREQQRTFLAASAAKGIKAVTEGNGAFDPSVLSVPKIIYASRTHAQLSQAAKELKRSFYSSTKSVVLGSRDVMCIHDGVSRLPTSSAKILGCHIQVKSRTCHFYNNVSSKKDEITNIVMDKPVMDIEDLVATGRRNKMCPFFVSRELVKDAHIIFMPYNYLMDPKLRSSHGVDMKNCIIILDEGHNIAKNCEESVSFEMKNSTITKCIQEVTQSMVDFNEVSQQVGSSSNAWISELNMGILVNLKQAFLQLESALDSIRITDPAGMFVPASNVLLAIYQNGFPPYTFPNLVNQLDAISSFNSMSYRDSSGCDTFASMLRILSSQPVFSNPSAFAESFKIFVTEEKRSTNSLKPSNNQEVMPKIFHFWCFNPAVGLDMMLQYSPRCIILVSGTLSPLPFLEAELRAPFPVKLSNPHVISDSQLYARILKTGRDPKCVKLSSAYANRGNQDYLTALADIVVYTCTIVPKGVLVFFPSYALMEHCISNWRQAGVMDKLNRLKALYIEPKGKYEFNQIMTNYYQSVKTSNGACLMAVCRGKVSEGLDFADDNGRAVIITGIPYAPCMDPHVKAKREYLDSKYKVSMNIGVSGANWYQLEAVRALNQAIGRIIRHAQDYGAVLLCDERFDSPAVVNNLSPWIIKRLKRDQSYSQVFTGLMEFFKKPFKNSASNPYSGSSFGRLGGDGALGFPSSIIKSSTKVVNATWDDIDMDADVSTVYSQPQVTSSLFKGSSGAGLFDSLESQVTRPAVDYVKMETKSVPAYENPWKKLGNTTGKRVFGEDTSMKQDRRPKRIKIEFETPNLFGGYQSTQSSLQTRERMGTSTSCLEELAMDVEMESLSQEAAALPFQSAKEFSAWVKGDLTQSDYSRFVEILREFKTSKNIQRLGEQLRTLFPGNKYSTCLQGLKFVMPDSTCTSLLQDMQRYN